MKRRNFQLLLGALALTVASAASARVVVSIGVNPYGYGTYAPPVVYQPAPYYDAPPVVYYGGGNWGHGRRSRGHDGDRNGRDRRGDGDHRDGRGH